MSDLNDDAELEFELPKSGVRVYADRVTRVSPTGAILFDVPLSSIKKVEFRRPISGIAIFLFLVSAGFIGTALYMHIVDSKIIGFILGGCGLVALLLAIAGLREDLLIFETPSGEIEISCPDLASDVKTFVVAMREFMSHRDR
jgi:hypothetical protein